MHGRLFAPDEDDAEREPTAVLADSFWRRRFGSDPAMLGKQVIVGGRPYTVIGVAPDAVQAFSRADVYLSLPVPQVSSERTNSFQVLGRIAPGVSRSQAELQVDAIARRSAQSDASLTNMPQGIVLQGLQDAAAPVRPSFR